MNRPNVARPEVLPLPSAGSSARVRWRFTDRAAGHSLAPYESLNLASHVGDLAAHVKLNRVLLTEQLGATGLVTMRPNHGRAVDVVQAPGESVDVDALVSATPGLGLLALGADCTPAIMFDESAGVVAAIHCGWLGLRDDVIGAALDRMRSLGASRVTAVLGPTICGACYAVPPERAAEVAAMNPAAIGQARNGQPSIDIRGGLAVRLRADRVRVHYAGGCTAETPTLFSHRRDGVTGRQGAVVMLDSA